MIWYEFVTSLSNLDVVPVVHVFWDKRDWVDSCNFISSVFRKIWKFKNQNQNSKEVIFKMNSRRISIMSAFSVLGPPLLITSVFAILPSRSHILKKQSRKGRRSSRHTRFEEFASIEVNGKCYMTPKDFLDEVTFSYPRPRIKRKVSCVWKRLRMTF